MKTFLKVILLAVIVGVPLGWALRDRPVPVPDVVVPVDPPAPPAADRCPCGKGCGCPVRRQATNEPCKCLVVEVLPAPAVPATDADLDAIAARIVAFKPDPANKHDQYVILAVREALQACRDGNYGVGAVLVGEHGEVIDQQHNHVYTPYHRGDLHAEMTLLLAAEEREKTTDTSARRKQTLYTSVEPCMMCFARVIGSGVKACYYAAPDGPSGMVHLKDGIPPSYKPRLKGRAFEQCPCSPALTQIATDIYAASFTRLGNPSKAVPACSCTSDYCDGRCTACKCPAKPGYGDWRAKAVKEKKHLVAIVGDIEPQTWIWQADVITVRVSAEQWKRLNDPTGFQFKGYAVGRYGDGRFYMKWFPPTMKGTEYFQWLQPPVPQPPPAVFPAPAGASGAVRPSVGRSC